MARGGSHEHYLGPTPPWARKKIISLESQELQALTLFANGRTADEIAVALGVSKGIAQHYLRVAARKPRARNRVHAVAIAVGMGLIELSAGAE